RTANPRLASRSEYPVNVDQHLTRIQRMFQHICQNSDIEPGGRVKVVYKARMNLETCSARYRRRVFIKLQSFNGESVRNMNPKTTTLVASDVKQSAVPLALVKRHVSVK